MISLAKRFLPAATVAELKDAWIFHAYHRAWRRAAAIQQSLIARTFPTASRWPLVPSLYALLSGQYAREHRAVMYGRGLYAREVESEMLSSVRLRRNVHRLEKGLSMDRRRAVFGTEYIGESLSSYDLVLQAHRRANAPASPELQWAHDVLSLYFQQSGSHPEIDRSKTRFQALEHRCEFQGAVPFRRDLTKGDAIDVEELGALAERRRSVRSFQARPVPRGMIDEALRIAALSPTACNRQPYRYFIFDEPDLIATISTMPPGVNGFQTDIPVFVAIVGQLRNYFSERDRRLIYIDSALSAMSFALALEVQGLATCMINWADLPGPERRVNKFLDLEPDERVVMCMAIGWPNENSLVPASIKKAPAQFSVYNQRSQAAAGERSP